MTDLHVGKSTEIDDSGHFAASVHRSPRPRLQPPTVRFSLAQFFIVITFLSIVCALATTFPADMILTALLGTAIGTVQGWRRRTHWTALLAFPTTIAILNWRFFPLPSWLSNHPNGRFSSFADPFERFILAVPLSLLGSLVQIRRDKAISGPLKFAFRWPNKGTKEFALIVLVSFFLIISLVPIWPASGQLGSWSTTLWMSDFFVIYD